MSRSLYSCKLLVAESLAFVPLQPAGKQSNSHVAYALKATPKTLAWGDYDAES